MDILYGSSMEIVWKYYGSSDAIANSIVRISPSVFSSVSY